MPQIGEERGVKRLLTGSEAEKRGGFVSMEQRQRVVSGRSRAEAMADRAWMGRGQAGGQQAGPLLPGGPGEGRGGLKRRFSLPGTLSLWLLKGPSHLFPGVGPLLTGVLPVYSCSKSGEDLFPSREPIYSAFSFSNPVTLQLFFVWLHLPNKRNYSLSFSSPG